MSLTEIRAYVYECDALECQTRFIVDHDDEPPYGYHGTVHKVDESGGHGDKWYACKKEHIRAAVLMVTDPSHD